jgi:hypothetical protein
MHFHTGLLHTEQIGKQTLLFTLKIIFFSSMAAGAESSSA